MLTSQLRSWSAALLSVAAIGCTDDAAQGPDGPDFDTEAPVIATTAPAANAGGVAAGDDIVITFSEAMDKGSIETTYESLDLPLSAVSMSWSDDMKVLTISPDAGLVYSEGTGFDTSVVAAKTYSLTIGKGAADLAGNSLGTDYTLTFATKRRMAAAVGLDPALTRVALGTTLLGTSNDIWVGDNDLDQTYRSYISFELTKLPAGATIEEASFSARQMAPSGNPYQLLGAVIAQHVTFATMNDLGTVQPMSVPGEYSTDGTAESKSIDVTAQVADDLVNRAVRADRSQFRLQIDDPTNENGIVDKASFGLATFEMSLVYIAD